MLMVPMSTGWPLWCSFLTSSARAVNLPRSFLNILSERSSRAMGLLVGMTMVSSLYILANSSASVSAVPVIPASFS